MDDAFNDARVYSPVWSSPGEDACAEPATVVAGAVKDQSRFAPYWVAWHLLLGASRVWVYDNDSQSASALRQKTETRMSSRGCLTPATTSTR